MDWTKRLEDTLDQQLAQRERMVEHVRAAYADGRWQAASKAQREVTRGHFQILNYQIRRTIRELEKRRTKENQRCTSS